MKKISRSIMLTMLCCLTFIGINSAFANTPKPLTVTCTNTSQAIVCDFTNLSNQEQAFHCTAGQGTPPSTVIMTKVNATITGFTGDSLIFGVGGTFTINDLETHYLGVTIEPNTQHPVGHVFMFAPFDSAINFTCTSGEDNRPVLGS